ncbi:energy transducer TonB [Leptospira idonii]|uniref:Energy transducer TonB n=1 Tax=Leptospira idonii TaxID=1193500 RepID=A0A4R9LZ23_9LEPT|nr:energy transducer TonB [Leptospira idonii]TGN19654.1 energy transducer TonB [Leptospira idonii]
MKDLFRRFKIWVFTFGLFKFSLLFSVGLHGFVYLSYVIYNLPWWGGSYEEVILDDVEVDFQEFPQVSSTSSPAPVEKQEWVEGSNKDQNAEVPDNTDINPNQVSGNGTDKDGYLLYYNGDRPPTPIIDFDLKQYFPEAAKAVNISRKVVVVMIQVDETGQLQGAKIVSGRAGYGFDEAALKITRMARYTPGYNDGKPTKMAYRMPILFDLEDE